MLHMTKLSYAESVFGVASGFVSSFQCFLFNLIPDIGIWGCVCVCVFFPPKASASNKNVLQGASKEGQQTPRTKSHSSQKHQTELQPLTQTQGRVMDPFHFLCFYAWSSWAMNSIMLQQSKAVKLRSPRGDITKTRLEFLQLSTTCFGFCH